MKELGRKDYNKPFILLFIAVGLAISMVSMGVFFYHESQLRHELNLKYAFSEFSIKRERLEINNARFTTLLHSISNNKYFLQYMGDPSLAPSYDYAMEMLHAVVSSHPNVMQLRYLDETGYERIRIDRTHYDSTVYSVPKDKLQDKSNRYYFLGVSAKKKGEYYISRLDLNEEQGTIEMPLNPVLRIALPIYLEEKFRGALVINVFMSELLQNITSSSIFYIYLFDKDNYILTSNDPKIKKWGRYLKPNQKINPEDFLYTDKLASTETETISLGLKLKEETTLISMVDKKIIFILIGIIIPIGFILAYFLAKIPKKLFDALEEREALMIQQSKMAAMGEMVGAIAHQWRQPLNTIGVLAQEIELKFQYGNLEKSDLKSIVNELMHYLEYMSKTIDDFRNFFKPSKQKTVFNVLDSIHASLEIVGKQLESHNIKIDMHTSSDKMLSEHTYKIEGYENEFKQVIINLINNSKEAIESNMQNNTDKIGQINMFIHRNEKEVVIRIQDNGGGIPEEMMASIFDLYVSSKYEQQGTGLGLYLSKLIIEHNMQGYINASNITDGAEFTIIVTAAKE